MIHPIIKDSDSRSSNANQQAETPVSSSDVAPRSTPAPKSKSRPRRKSKSAPETPTKDMMPLGPNFQPGKLDVICSRGKFAYNSPGNCWFRCMVEEQMDNYANARTKTDKSLVVSVLVNRVRQANPRGGFVKNVAGEWYRVSDRYSREKVGQQFRDLLHTKYRSSTKAKAEKRKRRQDDLENSVSSLEESFSNSHRSHSERNQQVSHSPARSLASSSGNALDTAAPKLPGLELLDADTVQSRRHMMDTKVDIAQQLPGLELENDDPCDIDLGFVDLEPFPMDQPKDASLNFNVGGMGLDETFPNFFTNPDYQAAPPAVASLELSMTKTSEERDNPKRRKNGNGNQNTQDSRGKDDSLNPIPYQSMHTSV